MSKNPTPRLDALRAMREANFERNAQRQKQEAHADKPAAPEKSAKTKPKAKKKSGG